MPRHHILLVDSNGESARDVSRMLEAMPARDVRCSSAVTATQARRIGAQNGDIVLIIARELADTGVYTLVPELKQSCPGAECIVIRAAASPESAVPGTSLRDVFAHLVEPLVTSTLVQLANAALTQVELRSERDELRAELEASENRHRELVAGLPGLVLGTDDRGCISLWNGGLEELTGRSSQDMLGTDAGPIIGVGGDHRVTTRDGSQRLVNWQLNRTVAADGKQVAYAVGVDVTEERAMLRRTLRAERLAAVGTLATGFAHEVRNPLNSASLQLEVLRRRLGRQERTDQYLPIVDTVQGELHRLGRLVTDFLAFARPQPLKLESTFASALVDGVAERISADAEKAGVTIAIEKCSPEKAIEADPERMLQVLCNLARNAIDAMPEGGALTLRVRNVDDRGVVALDVEDTGVGIPDQAPIFDAFFTSKQGGTGLGLAIVHRIVDDHGGSVHYESRPGATRFTIELPESIAT